MNNDNNTEPVLYAVGARGYSAYEVAVQNGFVGTEQEWLDSLVGPEGKLGPEGKSAYQVAVNNGYIGTEEEWVNDFLTPDGYYNKAEVDSIVSGQLKKTDVVNNLTSEAEDLPLSAAQGKVLNNSINNAIDRITINETNIQSEILNRTDVDNSLKQQIDGLASGSPLAASSTAGMTDTTKVYVNTTDGNWYYYDGDSWEIGGVYQSAALSKSTPAIAEVYDTLYNELYNDKMSTVITLVTGQSNYMYMYYPFKKGEVYKFSLISEGLEGTTGNYEVSTDSVPSPTVKYATATDNYFIFTKDASFLRVFIPNARITSAESCTLQMKNVYLDTGIKNEVVDILDLQKKNYNIISLPEIKNKTGNLIYDLDYVSGGVNNNTTIYDITGGASPTAERSQVLRIRDEAGNLYYDCTIEQKSGTAKYMNLYDSFGKYISSVYYGGGQTKFSDLNANTYYIVIVRYSTLARQRILYYGYENQTYNVGADYDFINLTALLKKLKSLNDKYNKKILVHAGTYDLYQEYGGDDYFSTVDMTPSNWRDNCAIIPENTHLIGLGKVTLNLIFPNAYSENSVFSSINCIRSCVVENLTINQSGGRYLAHIETAGGNVDQHIVFKNCILTGTTSTGNVIGSGISKGCQYDFENIIVDSTTQNSLYVHTNGHDGSFINIKNCSFKKYIDLQNWADEYSVGTLATRVNINNSKFERLILRSLYDSDTTSDFDVYSLCTNDYEVQKVRVTTDPSKRELII